MQSGLLFKRLLAFVLDWYFSSLCLNLASRGFLRLLGLDDGKGRALYYTTQYLLLEMLLCVIISFIYFVLIPQMLKKAQTPMMALLRLQITNLQGGKPSLTMLLKRFYVGSFLLQGYLNSQFSLFIFDWRKLLANYDTQLIANLFAIVSGVCLVISAYLAFKSKDFSCSLQDYLANTKVSAA